MIAAAQRRLDTLTAELGVADQSMIQFVRDVAQIQAISKISAEIEVDFPNFAGLHERYSDRPRHGQEYDHSGQSTPTWRSPSSSRPASRRGTMVLSSIPPMFSFGAKPWPRRAVLDHEGNRIDPIRQVELALDEARDVEIGLDDDKQDALVKLGVLRDRMDGMFKQHNFAKDWLGGIIKNVCPLSPH
jgi:hypothetical protein